MNITFKKVTAAPLFLMASLTAQANECGSINLDSLHSDSSPFVYDLVGNNSEIIRGKSDSKELYLAPGKHTLSFYKWRSSDYKKRRRTDVNIKQPSSVVISLDVLGNHQYVLSSKVQEGAAEMFVSAVINQKCQPQDDMVLSAKNSASALVMSLPENLQYRLDTLMQQLQHTAKASENVIPFSVVSYFGAVTEQQTKKSKTLRVLAVTPYSPASKLGLRTGDQLVTLGKLPITQLPQTVTNPIDEYIKELAIGQRIKVAVLRAGINTELSDIYYPTIVPEFSYNIHEKNGVKVQNALVNSSKLNDKLQLDLSKIILEVHQLSQRNSQSNQQELVLERMVSKDHKYGISGQMIANGSQRGFAIDVVKQNSAAADLGLQADDIITHFNNRQIKGSSVQQFSSMIAQLKPGQAYSMSIVRDAKEQQISGHFSQATFPAYSLNIDLDSVEKAGKLLEKYKKEHRNHRVDIRYATVEQIRYFNDKRRAEERMRNNTNSNRTSTNTTTTTTTTTTTKND